MRLLETDSLRLKDFTSLEKPPYGILSHTWAEDEITYQEMMAQDHRVTSKAGYKKIRKFCDLALSHGHRYVWVDTCCIDKSSSAELSEAINSMFKWYASAKTCYVYLADTPAVGSRLWGGPDVNVPTSHGFTPSAVGGCRWFKRGWTLQELLASRLVRFYDAHWKLMGFKHDLYDTIKQVTGVPQDVLEGGEMTWKFSHSVASRMSWAANRQTTREEDMAYSLLGLFGVNIGLIYGESHNAFRRLQEDIIKRNNDLTIFAWDDLKLSKPLDFQGVFATSPASFKNAQYVIGEQLADVDFSLTNLGIRFSGRIVLTKRKRLVEGDQNAYANMYLLRLGHDEKTMNSCVLHLRKIGPQFYYRDARFKSVLSEGLSHRDGDSEIVTNPCIAADFSWSYQTKLVGRRKHDQGIIRARPGSMYDVVSVVPESLWDIYDSCFLNPPDFTHDVMLALMFDVVIEGQRERFLFLCAYYLRSHSKYYICHLNTYPNVATIMFDLERRENSIRKSELSRYAPELSKVQDSCFVKVARKNYKVGYTFERGSISVAEMSIPCRDLVITVKQV